MAKNIQPMRTRVALASMIGTTVELYDFYIYGIASALIFNRVFFPSLDPTTGTIAALATFGAGFVSRPLGAVIFGHFGDRIGRKTMLVASLLTMGIATILIGLLPSYASIGIAAPIALCALRLIQGIGLGGEWGGAALVATEYATEKRRGLFGALPQLGASPGFLLSNGVFFALSASLTDEQFMSWGWRVPFLLSALLVAFGLYIRLSISETPVFKRVMEQREQVKAPILVVFRVHTPEVILGALAAAITYVLFYTAGTFGLTYGVATLGIPRTHMLSLLMIAVVAMGASTLICGMLGDRYGRAKVMIVAGLIGTLWALCFFPLLDTKNSVVIAVAMSVTLAVMAGVYGPIGAFLPEQFKPTLRYTGASVSYSLGSIVGGGLSPVLAANIAAAYGSHAVGYYMAVWSLVSTLAIVAMRGRVQRNFDTGEKEESEAMPPRGVRAASS